MNNPVGGQIGNKNGQKGEYPKESFLHMRIESIKKAHYVRTARNNNMKLAEWILIALDEKLEKTDNL